ncbi:hypothetical protein [Streptomyces sp. NPDC007984]|uniref:hypothetical protein n=1 Tax=Streptomyces sp. NPDC007984 TaxID=3364801 RepID=UPI0036EA091C
MASTIRIRVRADDDTDGFRGIRSSVRSLGRSLVTQLGEAGVRAGGALSSALTSSVGSVFSAAGSNPYVAAGIAALAVAAATAVGAALAGAITLAFGGAFIGLGVMLAAQNKEVRKAWGSTLGKIKKDFSEAAKPLLPVLDVARRKVETLASKFAPHFEQAMADAAPYLTEFLGHLSAGIEKFGATAFKPMMTAFNELLEAFGPHLEGFFESLGESFAGLGDTVRENKDEIALLFRIMLEAIPLAIDLLSFLAQTWGDNLRTVGSLNDKISELSGWFDRKWEAAVSFVEVGIDGVTNEVSGLWSLVNRNWFRVVPFGQQGIPGVTTLVSGLWGWVNRNWRRVVPFGQAGIPGVTGLVSTLWGWVNRNWKRLVPFRWSGGGVLKAVQAIWGWVNRNWFRTVTFNFKSIGLSALKSAISSLPGFAHGGIRGAATGGVIGRAASGGIRGNLTMVGEQGPELVQLPSGSRVRSNPDSRRIAQRGGGGQFSQFVFKSSGRRVDDLLLEILREAIHQRGGDPVAILGGR